MHYSKKWIVAYDGTVKRSQNRLAKDRLRGLTWHKFHAQARACSECDEGFWYRARLYCPAHAELREVLLDADWYGYWGRGCPPRWWRRTENRKYKRRMDKFVREGRDDECYPQPRTEGWYW